MSLQSVSAKEIFEKIKEDLIKIADQELRGYVSDLFNDTKDFIEDAISDVKIWSNQLEEGKLTQKEFEFLINGLRDRMEMAALTQAGLTIIKIQKIRDAVFQLIFSAALKIII